MGLFSKILTKLGIKKEEKASSTGTVAAKPAPAKPAAAKPVASKPTDANAVAAAERLAERKAALERKRAASAEVSLVDVTSKLENMAQGTNLDWKVSIVDLLKVLDIDSSLTARKELAEELGCPAELMGDSAKMNTWLHKEVLTQIAENGGNVPLNLLD